MGTGELSGKPDEMGRGGEGKFAMYWPPIQGVVLVLLVASS